MDGLGAISSELIKIKKLEAKKATIEKRPSQPDVVRPRPEAKKKSPKIQEFSAIDLEKVSKQLEEYVESSKVGLQFQVHKETGRVLIKVVSKEDGKVIREIPSEELVNIAAKMKRMAGVLFDKVI